MKYGELIQFDPIESVIVLKDANNKAEEERLVKSYVMSDDMAEKLNNNMISQLRLDEVVDNKGVLLVGNYGTGKSHLMSVVSAVAHDDKYLDMLGNHEFAEKAKSIAGKFEVLRIEIGASQMALRDIILGEVKADFRNRGLDFSFPPMSEVGNNKKILESMMEIFASEYPDKGYLIVVDEFLDFLGSRDQRGVKLDLGFMREIGEAARDSKLRAIFGVQEKLFDNPSFSFVAETLNRVKDRFEQVTIRKEDTAYVVSERILKKTKKQKDFIREHLTKFCPLYSNMSEHIEEYVSLFPIHPSYIDVFNKIYLIENRHILKNISETMRKISDKDVPENAPGVISYDTYWDFIKGDTGKRSNESIRDVIDKSGTLMSIVDSSFEQRIYKPYKELAVQIINALSVYRLTTGDTSIRVGLNAETLKDDLCLYKTDMPDQSADTLVSLVQVALKDIMTVVSGQFIEYNADNGQYFLDLKKDIDYDEKIKQYATTIADDNLNGAFFELVFAALNWNTTEHVPNYKIYDHTITWKTHKIFRRGYLFLGTPEDRPTAQPPEDYYIYFLPPYTNETYDAEHKIDEVFFTFKGDENFKEQLKLYTSAVSLERLADTNNKTVYQRKAEELKRKIIRYFSENKNTCFTVIYKGEVQPLLAVMAKEYNKDNPFKETIEIVSSILLDGYFEDKYPEYPTFRTIITKDNLADTMRKAYNRFSGQKTVESDYLLESFGLLENERITVDNSKYAQYYLNELKKVSDNGVVNFNDIYEKISTLEYTDKKFHISNAILPVVFLALVYCGDAIITLNDNTAIGAAELDSIKDINSAELQSFRHLSKPKDVSFTELIHLCKVIGIAEGLISNPAGREDGIAAIAGKLQEIDRDASQALGSYNNNQELWGESLIVEYKVEEYRDNIKVAKDFFANFGQRFNTVAKLANFNYTKDFIDDIEKDLNAVTIIKEYNKFRDTCGQNINYIFHLERDIDDADDSYSKELKDKINNAKLRFHELRDSLQEKKSGEEAGNEVNKELMIIKEEYIRHYIEEHNKRRLTMHDSHKTDEIKSSKDYNNLRSLSNIKLFSETQFKKIEADLTSLKTCPGLNPEMLKADHICHNCYFVLGEKSPLVTGKLDDIQIAIEDLVKQWTNNLSDFLSDPALKEKISFLKESQQKAINEFIKSGSLPETVDNNFVNAVNDLQKGFESVEISSADIISKLEKLGACDVEKFKNEFLKIVGSYTKDKDQSRLRIIIK